MEVVGGAQFQCGMNIAYLDLKPRFCDMLKETEKILGAIDVP